jgi:hypothetical protein
MRTQRQLELLKLHKKWCDRYVLYSLGVIFAIFLAISVVMDQLKASESERPGLYVVIATMMLATIIWNAAAQVVVRIHALIESLKPE